MTSFTSPTLPVLLLFCFFETFICLSEEHKGGLVGVRKLATAVDCSGLVAFSGTGTREVLQSGVVSYLTAITDRGVGWSLETGEFTIHCPGLYQLAFAGYGSNLDTRLILKKQKANATEWENIVSAGGPKSSGGSNVVLLDLEVGDRTAVWVDSGDLTKDSASFSAFRIVKK